MRKRGRHRQRLPRQGLLIWVIGLAARAEAILESMAARILGLREVSTLWFAGALAILSLTLIIENYKTLQGR